MRYLPIFVWLLAIACTPPAKQSDQAPNVLFIAVDDLRPEIGVYGQSQILTPNLDKLANAGVYFTRAYCNVPVCGASRASLLSGLRPTRDRFWDYDTRLDDDVPDVLTLPQHFREQGYHTESLGKVFHHQNDALRSWSVEPWAPARSKGPNGEDVSWRDYLTDGNWEIELAYRAAGNMRRSGMPYERAEVADTAYSDGKTAQAAIQRLRTYSQQDAPFFLAVGFLKPHLPFNAPARYWDLYDPQAIQLSANPYQPRDAPKAAYHNFGELRAYHGIPGEGPVPDTLARKMIHGYYACVSYVDAQIGEMLAELDRLGLRENTIVILWGDHGWMLGDHGMWCKHSPFEVALRTPLLLSGPGIPQTGPVDALVEFVDIYPTLTELAGLPMPGHLAGTSVLPVLNDRDHLAKEEIYCRWKKADVLRTHQYHYTQWTDDAGNTTADMLYDQQQDSAQNANLAIRPEQSDRIATFQEKLDSIRSWTNP